MGLPEQCRKEIIELHQFFEDWFTGRLEKSKEAFTRFSDILSPGFAMVFPDGILDRRERVIERVFEAHGIHANNPRYFRIWTDRIEARVESPELCLMSYEEWHEDNGQISARLSCAAFAPRAETPHGIEWGYVHETWLPGRDTHVRRSV